MNMSVQPVNLANPVITLNTVREVLTSNKITSDQKTDFIRRFQPQINHIIHNLSGSEFRSIMKHRPLRKFRPFKNSFTKRGDKILLASTLEIDPADVDDYISNVEDSIKNVDELGFLPADKVDSIKTYVYRHGSKDNIVNFLDYELRESKDILKTLYRTLEYYTGGVADYFIRPIHRMSNNTMVKIYNVVDKNLKIASETGAVSQKQRDEAAEWALVKIYQIQNNSKFINTIKTYKELK